MKKFILSVLCAFMGFAAIAQYNVGEVVEIDGVKTIVFHSDDEHTYAISLWAKDKDVRKKFKDELDEGKYLPYTDIKHMEAVFDDLSKMGRNNQDVVESYCEKNNVPYEVDESTLIENELIEMGVIEESAEIGALVVFLGADYLKFEKAVRYVVENRERLRSVVGKLYNSERNKIQKFLIYFLVFYLINYLFVAEVRD